MPSLSDKAIAIAAVDSGQYVPRSKYDRAILLMATT
jgi:hypothetical protein